MFRDKNCIAFVLAFGLTQAAWAGDVTVTQAGKKFSTETLKVKAGDTIIFKNDDNTNHNVFSATADRKFNLKIQKPGEEHKHQFTQPGTVDVRCAIHPNMKLSVEVTK